MKILFVCKHKEFFPGNMIPFNWEYICTLRKKGIQVEVNTIKGGMFSYFRNIFLINRILRKGCFDVVHASYGLSGLTIAFQKSTPSIITFVGSDLYNKKLRKLAKYFLLKRINASVFVSRNLFELAGKPQNGNILPFGVDFEKFFPQDKMHCRKELNMDLGGKYILFAGRFDREEKNHPLAIDSIDKVSLQDVHLIELKKVPEDKMNLLFNACDICLMTSQREGSPQVIKEAMACNKPIVSTDVGDVRWITGEIDGHYISSDDPVEIASNIEKAFQYIDSHKFTEGRNRLEDLNIDILSATQRTIDVYNSLID
jgi:teichuronic acid biosynthesis glycosyltransferase TuaC